MSIIHLPDIEINSMGLVAAAGSIPAAVFMLQNRYKPSGKKGIFVLLLLYLHL
jgi:hypothetical protein